MNQFLYDLVAKGTSGGECYGTETGSGPGYVNSCIHSGSNSGTGGNTVWYSYVLATAGTIKATSSSDTNGNMNVAKESICPKSWGLPTTKQISNISGGGATYVDSFSPVTGGLYYDSELRYETRGYWWGSEAYTNVFRYYLRYNDDNFYTSHSSDFAAANYIRCVSEEKDVSDLTYMQDMTPSVAANTAERTAFPTILQELCVIVNVLRA